MKFPDKTMMYGEMYDPAMKITDPEKANEYFEACVEYAMRFGHSRETAEATQRSNIGYWAGYYDSETADRVYRLFGAAHPVFGRTTPTPEEAVEAGRRLAQKSNT